MPATALIDQVRERLPRLLDEVSFGEDVGWEANIQLQPMDGGGMLPMVGIILVMSSPILGQEILGAAAVPLGVAQADETFGPHLRQMYEGLCAQRSAMLNGGPH